MFTIIENKPIVRDVYRLALSGDASAVTAPGQFVNIRLEGFYLRRPISVCDWDASGVTLIYKVVGKGTDCLSRLLPGAELDLLVGLGNGFDVSKSGQKPLLIGGGVGVPPLYGLAKKLAAGGKTPIAILGFNTRGDVFYADEFRALGVDTLVSTADGSMGQKGFVTDVMRGLTDYTYIYACGPMQMLQAVHGLTRTGGQFSFEERMGCGFGACMGCSCQTKYGSRRICREGPVLEREEIIW